MKYLLPPGIDTITAFEDTNTIVVVYTDDASLQDLEKVIRLIDVRPNRVHIDARVTISTAATRGHVYRSDLRASGATTGAKVLRLMSAAAPGLAGPKSSEVSVTATVLGDGSIELATEWRLDLTWPRRHGSAGAATPDVHEDYRTVTVIANGKRVSVTHATIKLPSGAADLKLELTPTVLAYAGSPANAKGANGP